MGENIEQIKVDLSEFNYDTLTEGNEQDAHFDKNGKYYYEVTVDKDSAYRNVLGDTTYLYKISASDSVDEIIVYDEYGEIVMPTGTDDAHKNQYRLNLGHTYRILFRGTAGESFKAVINSCWGDDKRAYIVVYDSYDEQFQNGLGNQVTSRYLEGVNENTYKNYDYNETFFNEYLQLLGNRQASFILQVRDLYFDGYTLYYSLEQKTDSNEKNELLYVKDEKWYTISKLLPNFSEINDKTDVKLLEINDLNSENITLTKHQQMVVDNTADKYNNIISNIGGILKQ